MQKCRGLVAMTRFAQKNTENWAWVLGIALEDEKIKTAITQQRVPHCMRSVSMCLPFSSALFEYQRRDSWQK